MFQLEDNRKEFWQWDKNQRIIVNDETITEVHYCNKTDACSLVTEVYSENGKYYSNVPNILLQTNWKINIYGYDSNKTKYYKCFKVNSRSKPADYIYTETEIKNYDALEARIKELEEAEVDLSEYVKNTDYATGNTAGVGKVSTTYGIVVNTNGYFYPMLATEAEIDDKTHKYHIIAPSNLDYAVKSIGNGYYATKEELGDIEAALDSIIAIQNRLIGG